MGAEVGKLIAFLEWSIEWGEHAEHLPKTAAANKRMPVLDKDLLWLWEGFVTLSKRCRFRTDKFIGGIPLSEVEAWLDINQIESPSHRNEVHLIFNALDLKYIELSLNRAHA